MPSGRALARARKDKRDGKSTSAQAGEFVREEIGHVGEGEHGPRSVRQAIAIGLSEARRAGIDVPAKKAAANKKITRKKPVAKKATAKKTAKRTSATSSRVSAKALKRGGSATSAAKEAAPTKASAGRKVAAKKASRAKGATGRSAGATRAARTRAMHARER